MKPIKLNIKTKTQHYPIIIGSNLVSKILQITRNNSVNFKKCLLIIDNKVPKIFLKKINLLLKKKNKFNYIFI